MNEVIVKDIAFITTRLRAHELSSVVLAVIAAEMYFRRPPHRFLEYCLWGVLWGLGSKRLETLSVGVAQVQLKTWRDLGFIDSFAPNLSNLISILSLENNYAICSSYLARFSSDEISINPQELAKKYSGRARLFHVRVIESALNIANEILLRKRSRQRAKRALG